eukprot:m.138796 g.138796  ORF g.138796 m.138796 type:complete len:64 (+) comp30015_c0_seq1:420-611(+)
MILLVVVMNGGGGGVGGGFFWGGLFWKVNRDIYFRRCVRCTRKITNEKFKKNITKKLEALKVW